MTAPKLDLSTTANRSTCCRLPDFLVIGAAKCGTTTFYQYLQRHPQVFMTTPKEMSFFSKDQVYARGLDWYRQLFAAAGNDQRCGEASTTYSRWPVYDQAAARIARHVPHVKLIYLLRNPVERLYSFYGHRMRLEVTQDFETFFRETPEAVESGRYMTQIRQYLEFFDRDRLLVLFTQDLKRDPSQVMEVACEFLELPSFDFLQEGAVTANRGKGHPYANRRLTAAINGLKSVYGVQRMLSLVPAGVRRNVFAALRDGAVGRSLKRRHQNSLTEFTPELRSRLIALYEPEIRELETFTGRDLAAWRT